MAVLSDAEREFAWRKFMDDNLETITITKQDLRTAVNDIDQWVDDNASSFNTAISQPARAALTATQKAFLLVKVVERRFLNT